MKKILILFLLLILLTGCFPDDIPSKSATLRIGNILQTDFETDLLSKFPQHSEFYIENLSVEDVILYFNEVCLDCEYYNSGSPELVQKWIFPIFYYIHGETTAEDMQTLNGLVEQISHIDGFPGMQRVGTPEEAILQIYFCTQDEMLDHMAGYIDDTYLDGATTFWYNGYNEITDAIICYRTDLDQTLRNSVILEEIYNTLGPMQDTVLREDSIAYQYSSEAQQLSQIDYLLLQLLYHPNITCGMNQEQCEEVIRELYY